MLGSCEEQGKFSLGLRYFHSLKHTASLTERRQIVKICFIAVKVSLLPRAAAVLMVRQAVFSLGTTSVMCAFHSRHLEQVTELEMLSLHWEFQILKMRCSHAFI